MSLECSECERDTRGGHDPRCPRYPGPPPACTCTFRLCGLEDFQHQDRCAVTRWQKGNKPPRKPPVVTTGFADDEEPTATLWEIVDAANGPGRDLAAILSGGVL